MMRFIGVLYGVAAYLFFLVTFAWAIAFVGNLPGVKAIDSGPIEGGPMPWIINIALLGLFAVQHSVMARQGFKRWWTTFVPKPVERSTYVLAATLVLALLLWQWRPIAGTVWSVGDPAARAVLHAVFWLGWGVLLLSTFLINHFELFGLKQVADSLVGRSVAEPTFRTPLLYKYSRHPLYLGFVLAFWSTPDMSLGHLLFAIATTGYILIGIFFEERDLVAHFGEEYRRYRRQVPMLFPIPGRRSREEKLHQPHQPAE